MEGSMKGEVVVVPFPFSNLAQAKNRPALILIDLPGSDVVLAAITSTGSGPNTVPIEQKDFKSGSLNHSSFVHAAKLFTFEKSLIIKTVGTITETKRKEIVDKIVSLLIEPT